MKKWLFNPFIYIAGQRALAIGLSAMFISAFIAYFSHTHFDGAIDMHTSRSPSPLYVFFIELAVNFICTTALFYAAARLFSTSATRLIDIAGTMALARWPMVFVSVIGFGLIPPASNSMKVVMESITPLHVVLSLLSLLFAIWMIALMYNAYTVSANAKGSKAVISFIGSLLATEIITHIILHQIYAHLT